MVIYGARGLTRRQQAHDLLARAAEAHWGLSPLPAMERGPQGKPFFPGRKDLEFNLSHSGPLALCALSSAPVGVDIQIVRSWRPSLPRRVCSDRELDWLEQGPDRWERFCRLWALKECLVKQRGTGLTRPISGIRVPLPGEEGLLLEQDGLWFRTYRGPGWHGAACGSEKPPEAIRWIPFEKLCENAPLQQGEILL